ncbi:DNA/RNA nuclease SfsA [Candidatus Culexarchaeum yellowstonense]|uniref:DNA/RNA nuclease SfsA n=1 Tax=Candidatus Culexarchaeum yellowstonense TaxID=2928963 RepID=UPI0026F1F21F|nr:DNA/RNA nuclease SfsA [Candidatus Culexarchaeum yellowstonense]
MQYLHSHFTVSFKLNYDGVKRGLFLKRLNRFRCMVEVDGRVYSAHIHDPGRLNELLKFGSEVLVRPHYSSARKTELYLFAVNSGGSWVLVDSALHNKIFQWLLNSELIPNLHGYSISRAEYEYSGSRFDFLLESRFGGKAILEVKGCTLVLNGFALFPDAPTVRGRRHVKCLIKALNDGYESIIFFLVTHPEAEIFKPNWDVDEEFSKALLEAYGLGVKVYACKVVLNVDSMEISWGGMLPIQLT